MLTAFLSPTRLPEHHFRQMRLAADMAGRSFTRPALCPPVGCVILDRWHRWLSAASVSRTGVHAELIAVKRATLTGPAAQGGVAVVTLDPCVECCRAFALAGIETVVYAVSDPAGTPEAGIQRFELNAIGGVGDSFVSQSVLRPWLQARKLARPFVTWVYAASPAGKLGLLASGAQDVQQDLRVLRAAADLTITDAETAPASELLKRKPEAVHVLVEDTPGEFQANIDRVVVYTSNGFDGATYVPKTPWMEAAYLVSTRVLSPSVSRTTWDFAW